MTKPTLLSLPVAILSKVFCRWLSIDEMGRLDSALCRWDARDQLLAILSCKSLVFDWDVDMSQRELVRWTYLRKVKVSRVHFTDDYHIKAGSEYLKVCGETVQNVEFRGGDKSYEMLLVALYCKQLIQMNIYDVHLRVAFGDLLWSSPDIQEIVLQNVSCESEHLLTGTKLTKLHTLKLVDTHHDLIFLKRLFSGCSSLKTLVLDNTFIDDWPSLLRVCKRLKSLGCSIYGVTPKMMEKFTLNASYLRNLSFAKCRCLTDACVMFIAKNLKSLCTLNIRDCPNTSDISLIYLAMYAGDRLEMLHADMKNPATPATEQVLIVFSDKCVKLQELDLNCGDKQLCAGRGAALLVRGCPSLSVLTVNKLSTIGESARELIQVLRPALSLLVHEACLEYDIMAF